VRLTQERGIVLQVHRERHSFGRSSRHESGPALTLVLERDERSGICGKSLGHRSSPSRGRTIRRLYAQSKSATHSRVRFAGERCTRSGVFSSRRAYALTPLTQVPQGFSFVTMLRVDLRSGRVGRRYPGRARAGRSGLEGVISACGSRVGHGRLQSIGEGRSTGRNGTHGCRGECRRCLTPVATPLQLEIGRCSTGPGSSGRS